MLPPSIHERPSASSSTSPRPSGVDVPPERPRFRALQHNPSPQPTRRPPRAPVPGGTRRRSSSTRRRKPPEATFHPMAASHGPPRLARPLLRLPEGQRSEPAGAPRPPPRQRPDAAHPAAGQHRHAGLRRPAAVPEEAAEELR